jgi:hypothetical protein
MRPPFVGRGVKVPQAFDPLRANLLSDLSEKHMCEKAAAHPDLAVDAPYGEIDPFGLERFVPSQYVLINAIDESAIEIKKKGSLRALHGLPIPSGNISRIVSEFTPPRNADSADGEATRAKCLQGASTVKIQKGGAVREKLVLKDIGLQAR